MNEPSWPEPFMHGQPPTSVGAVISVERMRRLTSVATYFWGIVRCTSYPGQGDEHYRTRP
jgi:hypothetical protein